MTVTPKVRVSYLISTRNRAEYLDKVLQNVRLFIGPEDEVLVFDGASTDHTPKIIDKHSDIVTVFRSERDFGEAHGFNKAILESRGRYIKFLTDDDYYYPEGMLAAVAAFEQNPDLDAVLGGGEMLLVSEETKQPEIQPYQFLPAGKCLSGDVMNILIHTVCGIGLFLHRRAIARVGLFDTSFRAIDTDYMSRMILSGINFKYLNVKMFRHTRFLHSGSRAPEMGLDVLRVLLRHGRWREAVRYQRSVGDLLGIRKLEGGDRLTHILLKSEQLRAEHGHRFLRLVSFVLRWSLRFNRILNTRSRDGSDSSLAVPGLGAYPHQLTEPAWDGALR